MTEEQEGYCMKCKATRSFPVRDTTETRNGAFMAKGPCRVCQTTVCKILPKEKKG